MSGRRGEEVGVAVRGRYSVCGVLATPGVPTHMLSTHEVLPKEVRKWRGCGREVERARGRDRERKDRERKRERERDKE